MWGFHLPIHDKRKVTPQIFDLGLVLCRCPQQAYGGGWDAAALTAERGSSFDYGILCQCDGDRLSGCLAHVFDAVIVATLRRSTRMTREEILQAIEDLTAQIRTLSYSSSKEAAAQRADLQQRRRELRAQLAETP